MRNYWFNITLLIVVIIVLEVWKGEKMPMHTFGAFVVITTILSGIQEVLDDMRGEK